MVVIGMVNRESQTVRAVNVLSSEAENLLPKIYKNVADRSTIITDTIAGGMTVQTELVFEVEVEKEINGIQMGVLKGGTPCKARKFKAKPKTKKLLIWCAVKILI